MHFIFAIFWVVCVNIFVQPLLSYFAEFSASWHNWRAGVGKGGVGRGRGEELYVTDTFVTCANIHRYPAFALWVKLVFAQILVHSLSILYSKISSHLVYNNMYIVQYEYRTVVKCTYVQILDSCSF